jgi:hypothetical protein
MTRRVIARSAALLLALGTMASFAPWAHAATEKLVFTYGVDQSSWYWTKQIDQEVAVPLPPPAPALVQRVRLPNPQNFDTLPVAVQLGEVEKTSAIALDISDRGVDPGSTITAFTLTIAEISGGEFPQFGADGRMIRACRINEFWAAGEAEKSDTQPAADTGACVNGERKDGDTPTDPPTWTWNLTQIAEPWGEDPFANNNGVLLVPVVGEASPTENWQINLKIPSRDDDVTPTINEYEETRDRVQASVSFEPPAEEPIDGGTNGGFDPGVDIPEPPPAPETPEPIPSPSPPDSGDGDETSEPASTSTPSFPGYVWLLVPVGLISLSAVRAVVLEGTGGTRPDGVVAAIRRRNAERRGETFTDVRQPGRFAAPFLALAAALRSDFANARSKLKRKPR